MLFLSCIFISDCHKQKDIELKKEIVDAVIFANSLEKIIWASPEKFNSRKIIFDHYRKGFSKEIAFRMTDHTWSDSLGLKAGDYATWPPDNVFVIKYDKNFATAYYETDEVFRDDITWNRGKYSIVNLRKENNQWIIFAATVSDKIPK